MVAGIDKPTHGRVHIAGHTTAFINSSVGLNPATAVGEVSPPAHRNPFRFAGGGAGPIAKGREGEGIAAISPASRAARTILKENAIRGEFVADAVGVGKAAFHAGEGASGDAFFDGTHVGLAPHPLGWRFLQES